MKFAKDLLKTSWKPQSVPYPPSVQECVCNTCSVKMMRIKPNLIIKLISGDTLQFYANDQDRL